MTSSNPTEVTRDPAAEPFALSAGILFALQSARHVYGGTVPEEVVAQRRAKNRDARRARRGNTRALRRQARLNRIGNRRRFGRPIYLPGISPDIDVEIVEDDQ